MILYTTMPQELVFQTNDTEFNKQMIIEHNGIPMLVERNEENNLRVLQIMSSNPNHYLDERYCPGTILSNSFYNKR